MHTSLITLNQAKRILGTNSKKYSDDELKRLIDQVESLTEVVIAIVDGSKIKRGIDILPDNVHTDR